MSFNDNLIVTQNVVWQLWLFWIVGYLCPNKSVSWNICFNFCLRSGFDFSFYLDFPFLWSPIVRRLNVRQRILFLKRSLNCSLPIWYCTVQSWERVSLTPQSICFCSVTVLNTKIGTGDNYAFSWLSTGRKKMIW